MCASVAFRAGAAGSSSAAKAPDAQAAFSFERIHTKVRFENDGSGRREQTLWIKVLDEQAVRQFGEFSLAYQSESEDLAMTEVAVQKPDGTVVPTPASSVQDLAAMPPGQLPIYIDVRQKVASVTALRPGDVLRITGVWTLKKPIAPGQFWFEHSFDDNDAVKDEQLELDLPADHAVALKIRSGAPAEEHAGVGAVAGGRKIYRWKTSHPEARTTPEVTQPGDDAPAPDVRLSSFRTWDEFARWFTPLAYPKPDAAVKAKSDALIAGAKDDAAKIAAVYRFVSTEIRYVSLSFGLGRFAAHPPVDVLKTQYGDCKDKAVLIRALLEAAGVRVVPVLIHTARSIDEDFASPLEFNACWRSCRVRRRSTARGWMPPSKWRRSACWDRTRATSARSRWRATRKRRWCGRRRTHRCRRRARSRSRAPSMASAWSTPGSRLPSAATRN